ncbi:hypothetical protein [Lacticaseibacillus sp. GG6-2]
MLETVTLGLCAAIDAVVKAEVSDGFVEYLPATPAYPAGFAVWRGQVKLMQRRGNPNGEWSDAQDARLAVLVEDGIDAYQEPGEFVPDAALMPASAIRVDKIAPRTIREASALSQVLCAKKAEQQDAWRLLDRGALAWYLNAVLVAKTRDFGAILCREWGDAPDVSCYPAQAFTIRNFEREFDAQAVCRNRRWHGIPDGCPCVVGDGLKIYRTQERYWVVLAPLADVVIRLGLAQQWQAAGMQFWRQADGGFRLR